MLSFMFLNVLLLYSENSEVVKSELTWKLRRTRVWPWTRPHLPDTTPSHSRLWTAGSPSSPRGSPADVWTHGTPLRNTRTPEYLYHSSCTTVLHYPNNSTKVPQHYNTTVQYYSTRADCTIIMQQQVLQYHSSTPPQGQY